MVKDRFLVINIFIEKDKDKIKKIVNEKMSKVINSLENKDYYEGEKTVE